MSGKIRITDNDMARMEPLLAEHLGDLRMANQRPRSVSERRYAVLRAARALGHPVADVTREQLVTWQRGLTVTAAGMHNETVHVRVYLQWCVVRGHRGEDPSAVLIRPKQRSRLPRPMGETDIVRAMSHAEQPLRAWIALAAFCGLRCMEIANLAREDVITGVPEPFLRINGKGGKDRIVPMPRSVLAELEAAGMPSRGYMFARIDSNPGPPKPDRVSGIINDHLHALGIGGTAHALRHRFGTALYGATKDLLIVATVMGHASTETTMGYVKISPHEAAPGIEQISRLGYGD